jgi:hypothetical protein
MDSGTIAKQFTSLMQEGKFEEAGETYWSADVVSYEASPEIPPARGLDGVRAKSAWWYANHEVHGTTVEGPYVNGDQFIVRFTMDVTVKASGVRSTVQEAGLYTLTNGKISEERFFYS